MRNKGLGKFTTPSIRYDCLLRKIWTGKMEIIRMFWRWWVAKLIYLHFSYMFEIKELENIKQLIYSSNSHKIKQKHLELIGRTHIHTHTHTDAAPWSSTHHPGTAADSVNPECAVRTDGESPLDPTGRTSHTSGPTWLTGWELSMTTVHVPSRTGPEVIQTSFGTVVTSVRAVISPKCFVLVMCFETFQTPFGGRYITQSSSSPAQARFLWVTHSF